MKDGFSVFITPAAERSCKILPNEVQDFVFQELASILGKNPNIGEALVPPLEPLRSFHFNKDGQKYRVAYMVDERAKKIIIHLVGHRSGFYERLRHLFG